MKQFLKDYFHYTRTERNGFIVLILIGLALLFFPRLFNKSTASTEDTDFTNFQSEIQAFVALNEAVDSSGLAEIEYFVFNPNTASMEDFRNLGLSEKLARIIQNFRNKGGRFYKKKDLLKIYGLKNTDYLRLEPYIVIGSQKEKRKAESRKSSFEKEVPVKVFEFDPNTVSKQELLQLGISKKAANTMMNFRKQGGTFRKKEDLNKVFGITEVDFERLFAYIKIEQKSPEPIAAIIPDDIPDSYDQPAPLKLEINTAGPEEWQNLRGIGPYYAKKICGFRDKLGGFYTIDQIAETYSLPDSTFKKIKPFLFLNRPVQKINLNLADANNLAGHPYLKLQEAQVIIKYRDQHGPFSDLDHLQNILALKKETIQKIKPYLSLN